MTPTGLLSVYVTVADPEQAERIGRALVAERLAACANILPGCVSIYRWEGALQRDPEAALLLKTRAELFEPLCARIRALHAYDVPCIVAFPIAAASDSYRNWVLEQTRPA